MVAEVDLTLVELFREEAVSHVDELARVAEEVGGDDARSLARFADECSFIRGAAICAGLAALARVLDWVERAALRREIHRDRNEVAIRWVREALELTIEGIAETDAARDEEARALVERWDAGVSDEEPAKRSEASPVPHAIEPAMVELFRTELEAHTFTMSDGLIALDADPAATERLDAVMRAAHSIKGAARILTIDPAVALAHAAEERVQAVLRTGDELSPEEIGALLDACDLLAALTKVPTPREWAFAEASRFDAAKAAIAERHTRRVITPPRTDVHVHGGPQGTEREQAFDASRQPLVAQPSARAEEPSDAATGSDARGGVAPVPTDAANDAARAVRVSAIHLERLLGLAGEGVMDARGLPPFARAIQSIVLQQTTILDLLSDLQQRVGATTDDSAIASGFERLRSLLGHSRTALVARHQEADDFARKSDELSRRIYRETIESRMRPFRDGVQWFPRLVFDVARKLGKQVDFRVIGDAVRVDRDILEKLGAPLNHLLRNALDHGIETPSERRERGKPDRATLTLEAKHWVGMLSVVVSDDGRGVDIERVRARIVERGLATAEEAATQNDTQVLEYLFAPGFSTRDAVSDLSGRGVGLDVVKTTAHEVGGSVRVHSQPGKGTSFQLLLPLTLSVTRAVILKIAGEEYAVPLVRVHRLVRVTADRVVYAEGRPCVDVEGERVGIVSGAEILGLPQSDPGETLTVVVLKNYLGAFAILVDALIGEQDLVVRQLDPRLGRVSDVLAAAVLPDGKPVLILDTEDLMRSVARIVEQRRMATRTEREKLRRHHVLVVDDSVTVRELERQLLLANGYEVSTAVDGADAWQLVRQREFDLVVSDVDMPRMDGLELTRSIRRDVRLRTLPIVIVSYRDKPEDRLRAEEAGATRYLPKSEFQEDALLQLVRELAGTRV
jgi:two-component system sensor histidine kinase and response regulator WspE